MMDDKTFDSMMDGINLDFFWHELRKDPEAKEYYPSTTARRNIFMFYIRHIRANDPPLLKLSSEGLKTMTMIREAMAHHADGLVTARHILNLCSGLAAFAVKHTPTGLRNRLYPLYMEIFYEQPKPFPAPIPKPTPNRLQELRERAEREAERKADRNFDELMREEHMLKAARKKKKCKRKSKAQRRKPPPYEPDVDGGEELVINCPPPPAYTPN